MWTYISKYKMSSSHSVCSQSSSEYEPEYEPESITISQNNLNITFQVLTVVPPPLEYMSSLHSSQQEISGRQVWCGSLLLSEYLLSSLDENLGIEKPSLDQFREKRTLELGSGTGIVGMSVATRLNPKCVALTDGDEEAVGLLIQNLEEESNGCSSNGIAKGTKLWWGKEGDGEGGYVEFCDWCRSNWPEIWNNDSSDENIEFDCLVAGDVLYKKELPSLFFSTVKRFMSKDGVLFLCHVPRANVTQQVVKDAALDAKFICEEIELTDWKKDLPESYPHEDIERACIYKITFP